MFILDLAAAVSKIRAEWIAYLLTAVRVDPPPDGLVGFLWAAIGTLGSVIGALALYIRYLLNEIRLIEKERHAHDVSVTKELTTTVLEMREAIKDVTEAMVLLGDRLEAQSRARRNNVKDKKVP